MREKLDIRKAFGMAVLTAAIAGCGSSAPESPKQTNGVTPTPRATEIFQPTPRPTQIVTETPKPTEKPELSMEQQASNAVFDYWFNLLNSTQQIEDGIDKYYLKTTIQNLSNWQHNLDIIKNGGASNSTLLMTWVGGEIYPNSNYSDKITGYKGIKSQGIMSFEQISLSSNSNPVTNSEKSQGITWSGQVTLDFKISGSENEFWPTDDTPYAKLDAVKNWIFKEESDPYWEADPISEIVVSDIKVVLKNGKWLVDKNKFITDVLGDPLNYVSKPVFTMALPDFCQNPDAVSSCQLIKERINY